MGDPCEICKGTEFVGKNKRCVRCAEGSAATETEGSGKGQSNTSRRSGKQLKVAKISSLSAKSSAQGNTSEDEDVEAGKHDSPLERTDIDSNQGEGSHREYNSMDLNDQLSLPKTDYGLILRSCLSEAQNEKLNELIMKIKPETVVFVAVMQKGDVQQPSPLLIISKERALVEAAHFPHESGTTVTLQNPGIKSKTILENKIKCKKWQPILFLEKGQYMLAGNWLGFVSDNDVQVGDMCIFVPLKDSKRSKFTVHVLPAKATHSTDGIKNAMIVSAVNAELPSNEGVVSTECNIHNEFPDGEDNHGPPERRPFILPRLLNLTTSQETIIHDRIKVIRSKYQLYVVTMNKSMDDGIQRKQFEFSKKYAEAVHLPTGERKIILSSMGKEWETKMKYRKDRNIYRWMIVDGWAEFARGNGVRETGLRSGDMCLFELKSMSEEEIAMEVHVVPKEQF